MGEACFAGIDIGGTKCAVVLGRAQEGEIHILQKVKFSTLNKEPDKMLMLFRDALKNLLETENLSANDLKGIGISCGGPLNSETGRILSPPNLPEWRDVAIVDYFQQEFHVPTVLQNDANACAVAEWKFGAGRGTKNMVFLTFGTGFGAGLILNGKLYCGACDMAGEIGHVRIAENGPLGYGKYGSLEGFCSGGGIANIGRIKVEEELKNNRRPAILDACASVEDISAKLIADLADDGDDFCREIYRISGEALGKALSILVDILNPERIVIGSIFARSQNLLWDACDQKMKKECLSLNYQHCQVVPSMLGESVGDIAALALIMMHLENN